MKPSNNHSFNGKRSIVIERELGTVDENGKKFAPDTVAETQVRVEPQTLPEVASDAESPAAEASAETKHKESSPLQKRKKGLILAGLGIAAVVGSIFGFHWWQYASTHEKTDDAYVQGNVHPISSRINGTVTNVLVDDNQQVKKGQLLVKLDPRDYQVQVQQAQASLLAAERQAKAAQSSINLASANTTANTTQAQGNVSIAEAAIATAQAAVNEAKAGVPAAQAAVEQAEANLQRAKADYNRYQNLYQAGAIARQQLDTAKADYQVAVAQRNSAVQGVTQAQAKLAQAQENVTKAQAQLAAAKGGLQQAQAGSVQTQVNQSQYGAAQAAIAQAQAKLEDAKLQLSYTNILAPTPGRIGNKSVEVGQRVQPGTPLLAIVNQDNWIRANFKETQLGKMHPGQPVEIDIDAFPKHHFTGHVESLAPGSGATFSLLPPDNATGNFTKIVQRIPVKVVFDPQSIRGYESQIVPGMSATVNVELK